MDLAKFNEISLEIQKLMAFLRDKRPPLNVEAYVVKITTMLCKQRQKHQTRRRIFFEL